jgi:hypothetical protein
LISKNFGKNKSIERLSLASNDIKLSSILCGTKKVAESLSSLTHLEISSNSLSAQSARAMAKFFEKAESRLVGLNLSKNRLSSKAANILIPAIKEHTSLQHLDLSNNWLNESVAPTIIDLLQCNSTLLSLDLTGNSSLKTTSRDVSRYDWHINTRTRIPGRDNGGGRIVKDALFDTTSPETIADSNHICVVKLSGQNASYETFMTTINALGVTEGKKIRFKVVHALSEANTDLFDPHNFASIPLELVPKLLEIMQQTVYFGNAEATLVFKGPHSYQTLNRIYEIITSWNTPLLFARGAGKLKQKKKTSQVQPLPVQQKKSLTKSRRRRKFGDDDDDDEPYIPVGARKRGRSVYNPELDDWEYIPPTVV